MLNNDYLSKQTSSYWNAKNKSEGLRSLLDVVAEDFLELKYRTCYLTNQNTSPKREVILNYLSTIRMSIFYL